MCNITDQASLIGCGSVVRKNICVTLLISHHQSVVVLY